MGYDVGTIEGNAYQAAKTADDIRANIMSQIQEALKNADTTNNDISAVKVSIGGQKIDISSGPGALVLDDTLQKLSTIEQSAAQLLAAKNRGQKEVSQLMR